MAAPIGIADPIERKSSSGSASLPGLDQLAAGKLKLTNFVDFKRGLLVLEATNFSNDRGITRSAERLCKDDLARALPDFERDFRHTIDDKQSSCDSNSCSTPGWEFGPSTHYEFSQRKGKFFLDAIVYTNGGSDDEVHSQAKYLQKVKTSKRSGRCGFREPAPNSLK